MSSRSARLVLLQCLLAAITVGLIDLAAFVFLPDTIAARYKGYRSTWYVHTPGGHDVSKDYYIAHPERGFDIGPHRTGFHYLQNVGYPIWSNRFGCFDTDEIEPEDKSKRLVYLAGDSFAWGFARHQSRLGTVFEKLTGVPTMKCGVNATGQRHQFSKFLEISGRIGRWPDKVLLFYYENDLGEDHFFPFQTVVDGWLLDKKLADRDGKVVEVDEKWLRRELDRRLSQVQEVAAREEQRHPLVKAVRYGSITAHILKDIFDAVRRNIGRDHVTTANAITYNGHAVFPLGPTTLTRARDHFPYASFEPATENKAALRAWQAHAEQAGYELLLFLIRPIDRADSDFYRELKTFLAEAGIRYFDLGSELAARGIPPGSVYRRGEGHFSNHGGETIGKLVAEIVCGPRLASC